VQRTNLDSAVHLKVLPYVSYTITFYRNIWDEQLWHMITLTLLMWCAFVQGIKCRHNREHRLYFCTFHVQNLLPYLGDFRYWTPMQKLN
jgi:hypothetical protein